MNIDDRVGFLITLVSIGIGFLLLGISVRLGRFKSWWLLKFNPIVPEIGAYLGIPASITFFVWASIAFFSDVDTRRQIFVYCGGPSLIVTFLLSIWRPRWLAPKWLLWLEDYHNDVLPLLKKEAQHMGGREWEDRVYTQADLEQWVAEVRRKHGL